MLEHEAKGTAFYNVRGVDHTDLSSTIITTGVELFLPASHGWAS